MAKYLECPDCGFVFKAPLADLKFTHLGFTFPGLGIVRCPECKEEKRRKEYRQLLESDLAKDPTLRSNSVIGSNRGSEEDTVGHTGHEHK